MKPIWPDRSEESPGWVDGARISGVWLAMKTVYLLVVQDGPPKFEVGRTDARAVPPTSNFGGTSPHPP